MSLLHKKVYNLAISINEIIENKILTIGSGFILKYEGTIYAITNKHVLYHQNRILINFNGGTFLNKKFIIVDIKKNSNLLPHKEKNIDLVAIKLSENDYPKSAERPIDLTDLGLKLNEMRDYAISEGDEIYLIGHPLNITSQNHYFAIARSGTIAQISHLYEDSFKDKSYLIDCLALPGNSGGPVFLKPKYIVYKNEKKVEKIKLIGFVNSAIFTNNKSLRDSNNYPAQLSNVVPLDYLFEILENTKQI
jgi:hypothetical protein